MTTSATLTALVVHESMFHNTEAVARAVAAGLESEGFHTRTVPVSAAPPLDSVTEDLLVVGAPTHAFSLSRPATRADAVRHGAAPATATTGVRNWLAAASPERSGIRPCAAMFDTRVRKVQHLPASAATRGRHLLLRLGFTVLAPPRGFLVDDLRGPLLADELDHAVAWGRTLGRDCEDHVLAAAVARPGR